jgi:hypothetical protein
MIIIVFATRIVGKINPERAGKYKETVYFMKDLTALQQAVDNKQKPIVKIVIATARNEAGSKKRSEITLTPLIFVYC